MKVMRINFYLYYQSLIEEYPMLTDHPGVDPAHLGEFSCLSAYLLNRPACEWVKMWSQIAGVSHPSMARSGVLRSPARQFVQSCGVWANVSVL